MCSVPTGLDDTPGVDTVSPSCTHQLHFLIWKMELKIASPECPTEFECDDLWKGPKGLNGPEEALHYHQDVLGFMGVIRALGTCT